MQELNGKVAVVTGGGSGIGRAMALAFADEGMDVAIGDIESGPAERVADEVRAKGRRAIAVTCDVADAASVRALAEATRSELGGAHVVCNNAGVVVGKPSAQMSDGDWAWVLGGGPAGRGERGPGVPAGAGGAGRGAHREHVVHRRTDPAGGAGHHLLHGSEVRGRGDHGDAAWGASRPGDRGLGALPGRREHTHRGVGAEPAGCGSRPTSAATTDRATAGRRATASHRRRTD